MTTTSDHVPQRSGKQIMEDKEEHENSDEVSSAENETKTIPEPVERNQRDGKDKSETSLPKEKSTFFSPKNVPFTR